MADKFLAYLRNERDRLDQALSRALTAQWAEPAEIASLRQQRLIVDDQLTRWTRELCQERVAA